MEVADKFSSLDSVMLRTQRAFLADNWNKLATIKTEPDFMDKRPGGEHKVRRDGQTEHIVKKYKPVSQSEVDPWI